MNINPFIDLFVAVLDIYSIILIISIILNWLIAFDVINRHNHFVSRVHYALYRLTEPVLKHIRRYMPNLGGIDISPIVVFLLIKFISNALYTYFYMH